MKFYRIINIQSKKQRNHLKVLLTFALLALVITIFAPKKQGFIYQFYKGKPWQGELLTAPYDFPVYKSEAVINMERDSIKEKVPPIYMTDVEKQAKMLQCWKENYQKIGSNKLNYQYFNYINSRLRKLYENGIIGNDEKSKLRDNGHLEVSLMSESKELQTVPISRFLTLKEAYESFFDNCPKGLSKEELSNLNIDKYLQANIYFDESRTEKLIKAEMDKLSLSTGMIQTGERIVDKGEIVDGYTYNVLNSLRRTYNERAGGEKQQFGVSAGTFFLVLSILMSLWLMLNYFNKREFVSKYRNVILLVVLIFSFVSLTQLVSDKEWFSLYIIPYVILPILLRTFFNTWIAFVSYLSTLLVSLIFVSDPVGFMIMQTVAGIVALSSLQNLTSRWQLIRCTFLVFVSYIITFIFLSLLRNGEVLSNIWITLLFFGINLIFMMFTYLLVYLIEKGFGYVSNISLVELSDINTPLLRQLSEIAPGTFQHSLQVSILSTEAASRIGADVQLIRTGALYHDIGKMKNPTYFTENQAVTSPHEGLPYDESARIIIRHVTDGIALAQKHNLPEAIIDFIRTHHGRGQAKYFYNSYYNQHQGEEIDIEQFTYPGPNPFSKETGILMLADAVEATSRSLKEVTEQGLEDLVNRIVGSIIADGLLNDTPITFHDVQIIKEVFISKLKTMYHARITYPERIGQPTQ